MSLTVSTMRCKNVHKYTTATLVTGMSIGETLTRDYDQFDPYVSVNATTTPATFYTPTAGETGTVFVITFDSDSKYTYQEFTYDAALTIAETAANKLTDGTKTVSVTNSSGNLQIAMSAGTGTCKIRMETVRA